MAVESILGMALSIIGTEHFMSAGLSSPWSVSKFAQSLEDKDEVWHYFNEAGTASLIFGAALSYQLKTIWPLAGSGITVLYYKNLYNSALKKADNNMINIQSQKQQSSLPNFNSFRPMQILSAEQVQKKFGFK